MTNGKFVISLDFELQWGVRDKKSINHQYSKNIVGVHTVIPRLLSTFKKFEINGTFSTVGFLFFESKEQLLANIPANTPAYVDQNLSPYTGHFDLVGANYKEDLYHFAPQLLAEIKKYPEQEIGSHTYSHYYCLENGQTIEQFRDDLNLAIKIAENNKVKITSLVFPRNQFNEEYLKVCTDFNITCYRGNEHSWIYEAKKGEEDSSSRRILRLLDTYINISGHNCYSSEFLKSQFPINLPSSRFLRPYSNKLKIFEKLRLYRIKSGMTYAAKNNLLYHLWWHPHNFGVNQDENFQFLEKILEHYSFLQKKYKFESITMSNLAHELKNETK